MLDPDLKFKHDFNYSGKFYHNDTPEYWGRYSNPTTVKNVYYKLNSNGYRCDEFDLESELPVVFMGCSHTFGLGLPLEDTWAYQTISNIRNKTNKNIPYWNLARNGSSIDLQFYCLNKHIKTLKPKFIFFLVPSIYRRCIMFNNHFHDFKVSENMLDYQIFPEEISKSFGLLAEEYFAINETHKYFMLINALCERHQTQLLFQYSDVYEGETSYTFFRDCDSYPQFKKLNTLWANTVETNDRTLDYARDRMHRGPLSNAAFSNELWQEINSYF